MADKKIGEKNPMREYVTVNLPRASGKEENFVFVGLNGKGYTIRRGLAVRVPKPVAAILKEQQRQMERQAAYEDRMNERRQRTAANLGIAT